MDKKSKEQIKEIIKDIIQIRDDHFYKYIQDQEELNFYKNVLPNAPEDTFNELSEVYSQLGISQEEIDHIAQINKPTEEELEEQVNNVLSIYQVEYGNIWSKYVFEFDGPLVKLNKLLKKEDQFQEILEIEKYMRKIHSKQYITVKEFTEIYGYSKTSQQNYRGRLNDPLPYRQVKFGGKITYDVEAVEQWFENQHKYK